MLIYLGKLTVDGYTRCFLEKLPTKSVFRLPSITAQCSAFDVVSVEGKLIILLRDFAVNFNY